jgi:hypothetical protein
MARQNYILGKLLDQAIAAAGGTHQLPQGLLPTDAAGAGAVPLSGARVGGAAAVAQEAALEAAAAAAAA